MMSNIECGLIEVLFSIQGREWAGLDDQAIGTLLNTPINDFALDSLERMDLVMRSEERFGIDLDERDVIACKILRDFANLIQRQIG
jgi:acyl carrier protein